MSGAPGDSDRIRSVLLRVRQRVMVNQSEVTEALAALDRLSPPGAEVLVSHTWCTCEHQHDTYTATGKPVRECAWVFCRCPGFRPYSLPGPSAEQQEAMRERLNATLRERDAEKQRLR